MLQESPVIRLLEQQRDEYVHLEVTFYPEHIYFKGHFPDFPVYPGVAQIALVDALAQQYLGVSGECRKMQNIKFIRMIRPNDVLQLELTRENDRVLFRFYNTDANIATGCLTYTHDDR